MSSSPDLLFEMRNAFYLGNSQQCINEAQKSKVVSNEDKLERDVFMYRAYILQKKYGVVSTEIKSSMPSQLQAIKALADYMSADTTKKAIILKELESKVQTLEPNDYIQPLMLAIIYYYEQSYESALRVLHSVDSLECCAMVLQIYLKLDRIDLARKELKRMQEKEEDSTQTQLAQAWIGLAIGGEKLQDSYYIFQELSDKYGSTPLILNGQSAALIGLGKYDEAESLLQESIDKDSNNTETIINSIVLNQYMGKAPEVTNRYISQLKDSNVDHPFIKDYLIKEREIEHLAQQYSI